MKRIKFDEKEYIDPKNLTNEFQSMVHDISCQICLSIVHPHPVSCGKCFKMFCRSCLEGWMKTGKKCPNNHDFTELKNILAYNMLNNFILKCPNDECSKLITYESYLNHLEICDYSLYECLGCRLSENKLIISDHIKRCDQISENCKFCKKVFKRVELPAHLEICDESIILCVDCNANYVRKEKETHFSRCPEKIVSCENCDLKYKRKFTENHTDKECIKELKLLLVKRHNDTSILQVLLSKKNQELFAIDSNMQNMQKDLDSLRSENSYLKSEIIDLKNKIQLSSMVVFNDIQNKPANKINYSTENKKLFENIFSKRDDIEFCDKIKNILFATDRKDFILEESISGSKKAYSDSPLAIGFNTSISAPHMHAFTMYYLNKYLDFTNNMKGLDLGSGSGYMTVCISKLLGPASITYAVDHINELIKFSELNIRKNHRQLIDDKKILFFCLDAREEIFKNEKFNIIHFGAAYKEFPESYSNILADGGVAWIPCTDPDGSQTIKIFKKNKDILEEYELMKVKYASLTSIEDQLQK